MRNAYQALIDRHPALRTTYKYSDGLPVQNVHSYLEVQFEEIDASGWSEAELQEKVTALYKRPYDLEQGPVMRVHLLMQSETDYVLLQTIHHIACDGWSIWLLLSELRELYRAEANNLPVTLGTPEREFTDYVQWEQRMLGGLEGEELLEFWKGQMAGELPVLNLPYDRPRPKLLEFNGKSKSFVLGKVLTKKIKNLAKSEGATLFMLLLAAYFILLHRYSGQDDILVGTPTFGRNQPEYARTVGLFINQVPVRVNHIDNPSFSDFLSRIRRTTLEVLDHANYPFVMMADNFWRHRERNVSPICQVEFILQKPQQSDDLLGLLKSEGVRGTIDFGGLKLEYYPLNQQEGQLDLTLEMVESDSDLLGNIKYNSDLFDDATAEKIVNHFRQLLASIVTDPSRKISSLPIMTERESHRILVEWNSTKAVFPGSACVHELIEARAKETPKAIAVEHDSAGLTYEEMNRKANQLAHYLESLGVGPNIIVGVCLERSFEMIIALIAVLKAGGAYLPLDPSYPKSRLTFMLEDARVRVLLAQSSLRDQLPEAAVQRVFVDKDWDAISSNPTADPVNKASGEDLAYIIYTSGSTGKPKGVMIRRHSLENFVESVSREYAITSADRILQFASINFDASAEEIYPCLTRGATLVLRSDEMIGSISLFLEKCRDWQLTVLDLPTSYWHELTLELEHELLIIPESVRLVIIGGERAQPELLRAWHRHVKPTVRLLNTYGPTEATVVATICDATRPPEGNIPMREVPVGRPIANTQVYILDRNLQAVPAGVSGELHIAGEGLAAGYLNRTDLTAEKFIANPFAGDDQARLYKTGDLARYLPDGNIEFLGRIDRQCKIRGFRIEIGEIESELKKHTAVKHVHVTTSHDGRSQARLIAYVVTIDGASCSVGEIHEHLKVNLPDYMVPSAVVILDALPFLPSGKVDAGALPEPDLTRSLQNTHVAPRNHVEEILCGIWAHVLKVSQVGIYDNFFEMGGHSLLLLRVISKLEETLKVKLPFRQFFVTPTIAEIGTVVEALLYLRESSQAVYDVSTENREEIEI